MSPLSRGLRRYQFPGTRHGTGVRAANIFFRLFRWVPPSRACSFTPCLLQRLSSASALLHLRLVSRTLSSPSGDCIPFFILDDTINARVDRFRYPDVLFLPRDTRVHASRQRRRANERRRVGGGMEMRVGIRGCLHRPGQLGSLVVDGGLYFDPG